MSTMDSGRGSPWSRLFRVLTQPGAAMAETVEQPAILPPYLIWMLIVTAVSVAVYVLNMDSLVAATLEQSLAQMEAQGQSLPPDQLQAMQSVMPITMIGTAAVGGLVMPWIGGLYYAAVLYFFGSLTGKAGPFKQYLSVAGYAAMPQVLNTLLAAPLMLAATTPQELAQVGFHLGALAPEAGGLLLGVLRTFDVFGLWSLVLVVMGYAAIHRVKPARAAWVGLFFLALRVLGNAAGGAVGSGFGGLGG